MRVCVFPECADLAFALRCSHCEKKILPFKVHKFWSLFWIISTVVCWSLFRKQHWMCAGLECVVIHRGQAGKKRAGAIVSVEVEGRRAASSQWGNMTRGLLPAPVRSHVTEESHLHINLRLYCSFLSSPSSLPLAQYAVSSEWDKDKSHVYCEAACHLLSSPSSTSVLVPLLWRLLGVKGLLQMYFS